MRRIIQVLNTLQVFRTFPLRTGKLHGILHNQHTRRTKRYNSPIGSSYF